MMFSYDSENIILLLYKMILKIKHSIITIRPLWTAEHLNEHGTHNLKFELGWQEEKFDTGDALWDMKCSSSSSWQTLHLDMTVEYELHFLLFIFRSERPLQNLRVSSSVSILLFYAHFRILNKKILDGNGKMWINYKNAHKIIFYPIRRHTHKLRWKLNESLKPHVTVSALAVIG